MAISKNAEIFLTRGKRVIKHGEVNLDIDGQTAHIKIHGLTQKQIRNLRNVNTLSYQPAQVGGDSAAALDQTNFAYDVVAAGIDDPDLNSASLQDAFGVMSPVDLAYEMFEPDEAAIIASRIIAISDKPKSTGVDKEKIDEAKN